MKRFSSNWRILSIFLLVLLHAAPLLFSLSLLFPEAQKAGQEYTPDPEISFVQSDSFLSVSQADWTGKIPPEYVVRLDTISQSNIQVKNRQDVTLLFEDGTLIGHARQTEPDQDTVLQRLETKSTYNHLFQAVSFHQARSGKQTSRNHMSSDYLYVSATKFGGIQSFRQPETMQQQGWKDVIDRSVSELLVDHWRRALHEFQIDPGRHFLFPLTQLPLYVEKEELPGISAEHAHQVIEQLWKAIDNHFLSADTEGKVKGRSMPLILLDKDGGYFIILYQTADGYYHRLTHSFTDFK